MIEGRFIVFSTAIIGGGKGGRDLDFRGSKTRIKTKTKESTGSMIVSDTLVSFGNSVQGTGP